MPSPSPAGSRRARGRWRRREWWLAAALLAPNLVLLAIFTYRPLVDNIRLSFFAWNISSPNSEFIGLDNYREWLSRDDTLTVLGNTVVFTLGSVAGSMIIGLLLALMLDQRIPGRGPARAVVFAPYAISGAAVGVAFQFIFDPRFGMVQDLLGRIGIDSPDFYQESGWALFMLTATFVWKNVGFTFVIYLAALQGLNRELSEAAAIDNASRTTHFFRVVAPQLRPTTFFLSITVTLSTMQAFDLINVITRGGPQLTGTTTLVYQVYQETFVNFRAGYGAAIATILFLVLLVITLLQVRAMDRNSSGKGA